MIIVTDAKSLFRRTIDCVHFLIRNTHTYVRTHTQTQPLIARYTKVHSPQ